MPTDQIISILQETPGRLRAITTGMSATQLCTPPKEGEWSVIEVLAHLRSCADVWGGAIEQILTDRHPTIRAVNPRSWIDRTDYPTLEFAPSLRAFTRQRSRLCDRLEGLGAREWARTATVLGGGRPIERSVQDFGYRMARHERTHWKQVAHAVRALSG
jgi:hypothetical protein